MRGGGRHREWGCRCCLWCSRVGDLRVWVSGFHFLRDFPKKRTGGTDFVWGCFWHSSTSAMWVFKSSKLIINVLFRISCRPVKEFCQASFAARAETERWPREAFVFWCIIVLGNHLFIRISPGPLGLTCRDPRLKLLLPLRRRMSGKGALEKDLSRLLLRVIFSLIYIVDLFLGQWFAILVFAADAEIAPRVSGRDDVPTGVETDGQPRGRRAVVTRRLLPLAAGFTLTCLKLSTVGVEVGS